MSIQLRNKYDPTQPTHIYYDSSVFNNDASRLATPVNFNYTEFRNNPFLACPENYFMSIIRFQLQTPLLPVFIPSIALGAQNIYNTVNQTVYRITLEYTYLGITYSHSEPIIYTPSNLTASVPPSVASLNTQSLTSEYYHIYSYQRWIQMINTCFQGVFGALNLLILNQGGNLPTTHAPFMEMDPNNLTCILNGDLAGYTTGIDGSTTTKIKIYFNTPLYTLYNNFPLIKRSINAANHKDVQMIMYNFNNTNLFIQTATLGPPATTYNAIQIYQEGETAALLNPIVSISFTTTLLPVNQEEVGLTQVLNDPQLNPNVGNNSLIAPIITDFQVPFSALNTYKPEIQYTPSGEYRMIDLFGRSPLSSIDIQCQWKDAYGNFHDFILGSGCRGDLKILFRRKDFYSNGIN